MQFRIEPLPEGTTPPEASASARDLLGRLVEELFGIAPLPDIKCGEEGKPFFPAHPDIRFSLSHCRRWVMAAADVREIGCDIEDIDEEGVERFGIDSDNDSGPAKVSVPDPVFLQTAFSPTERDAILTSDHPAITMISLWTRKEAIVKRGGHIPDDPRDWPSDSSRLLHAVCLSGRYAFAVAT